MAIVDNMYLVLEAGVPIATPHIVKAWDIMPPLSSYARRALTFFLVGIYRLLASQMSGSLFAQLLFTFQI